MTARLVELALFTEDVAGMTAFYERLLATEPTERSERHAAFMLGEVVLRVHEAVEAAPGDSPAANHVAFAVGDLDGRASALEAEGIQLDGPRDLPWGRSAYARDPDGNLVELTS